MNDDYDYDGDDDDDVNRDQNVCVFAQAFQQQQRVQNKEVTSGQSREEKQETPVYRAS